MPQRARVQRRGEHEEAGSEPPQSDGERSGSAIATPERGTAVSPREFGVSARYSAASLAVRGFRRVPTEQVTRTCAVSRARTTNAYRPGEGAARHDSLVFLP